MEVTGIAAFYLVCLCFGFLLALVGAIFGGFAGHGMDFGHGVPGGHEFNIEHAPEISHGGNEIGGGIAETSEMPGASFFNMITISTLVAFFGLFGLLEVWGFRASAIWSLAVALPASIAIAIGQFLLYVKLLVNAQASSEARLSDVIGHEAEVITGILENGIGEIAYVVKGSRYTAPAASVDSSDIPRGARVIIESIRANTLIVKPYANVIL
ncbi:MAG: NfeD family protein [Armatimonadetes bacterium]|nr:NfeD family protein [Armatimonadota bacterium]